MNINVSNIQSFYNLAKQEIIENRPNKALIYIQIHLKYEKHKFLVEVFGTKKEKLLKYLHLY